MANIVDALVVTLGLDASAYVKESAKASDVQRKMSDQEQKASKDSEDLRKKQIDGYRKLGAEVLGLFAIFTAGKGMKEFAKDTANNEAALGRLAKNVNTSAEELSAWEGVAIRAGGSAADADNAIQGLTDAFEGTKIGTQSPALNMLVQFGVRVDDGKKKLRNFTDLMLDTADKFSGMDRALANRRLQVLPISQGMRNAILDGRPALEKYLEEQKKLGVVTTAQTEQASKLQNAFQNLDQVVGTIGRKLLNDLAPAIIKVLNALTDLGVWFVANPKIMADAFVAMSLAAIVFSGKSIFAIGRVIGAFGGLNTAATLASNGVTATLGTVLTLLTRISVLFATLSLHGDTPVDNKKQFLGEGAYDSPYLDPANPNHAVSIGEGFSAWYRRNAPPILGGDAAPPGRFKQINPFDAKETFKPTFSSYDTVGATPRGIRNNNPGNLNYVGQDGAQLEGGANARFAQFRTAADGYAALGKQLQLYASRGIDTVRGIISKYAPESENDTGGYITQLAGKLGVGADTKLDLNNPSVLRTMMAGISGVENGGKWVNGSDIDAGLQRMNGNRYAQGGNNTTSHSVQINGPITINTKATDATGIAGSLRTAMRNTFAPQANVGLA